MSFYDDLAKAAIHAVRASQNTTIDSVSVDRLRRAIDEKYPELPENWPYRWVVSHEEINAILYNLPPKE